MDKESTIRLKYLRIMSLYALVVLFAVISFVFLKPKKQAYSVENTELSETTDTQPEYVYVSPDIKPDTDTQTEEERYTVKSYMGKIGIFTSDGKLAEVIEVYVKTLPEADKRLLEEGFEIVGRSQLNSIIEDYSD